MALRRHLNNFYGMGRGESGKKPWAESPKTNYMLFEEWGPWAGHKSPEEGLRAANCWRRGGADGGGCDQVSCF